MIRLTTVSMLAGALALVLAAVSPAHATYDMPRNDDGYHLVDIVNKAMISMKVQARYHKCFGHGKPDSKWHTTKSAHLVEQKTKIKYDQDCQLVVQLSCNGCSGKGQFITPEPANPFKEIYACGDATKWKVVLTNVKDAGGLGVLSNKRKCKDITNASNIMGGILGGLFGN